MNNILIFSNDPNKHLDNINAVLDCLINHNFKVSIQKFNFAVKSLKFLGQTIRIVGNAVNFTPNKPPLNRGTVALPLFVFFSCENHYPFYPF